MLFSEFRELRYFEELEWDHLMRKLAFLVTLTLIVIGHASGQVPLADVNLIEGPWECASQTGIKGIFVTVETAVLDEGKVPNIDWQTVTVGVYQRTGRKGEDVRYFALPLYRQFEQEHEKNYETDFENRHLVIHDNIDLDLRFDADAKHWIGIWTEHAEKHEVVLERPRPPSGAQASLFVGDWESNAGPQVEPISSSGRLHIRESLDGIMTAWLDRELSGFDARMQSRHSDVRNGERLKIFPDQNKLILATTAPVGAVYHYKGTLSSDGKNLFGYWQTQKSGRLSAPADFVRMTNQKFR